VGVVTRTVWVAAIPTVLMIGGCTPSAPVSTTPRPTAERPPAVAPPAAGLILPATQPANQWLVSAVTRLNASGSALPAGVGSEQRIDTRARITLAFERSSSGALRGRGQVDSFTVRNTLDPVTTTGAKPTVLLIDAVLDSSYLRVVSRPPLANECDRPEVSAMQLARELLVRIPDGVAVGDAWRDSTVTLVCRSGMPLTVYTTSRSKLAQRSAAILVVERESTSTLDGKGGSAFRAFELTGSGSGMQRLEINATTGILERLQGTSTLTLQVVERIPPGAPRLQQVLQRVEIRAERVR
jgi:hypothetical protein